MFQRILVFAAALAAVFVCAPARAFTPESGFWWNRAEPGTGINIEIQDNFLALTGYVFANDGRPQWYTAQGVMTGNSRFNGTLDGFSNGQALGGVYRAPTVQAGAGGPISINFLTETTANVTWGGRTVRMERFDFYLTRGAADPGTEKMLGEWQLVLDLYDRAGSNFASYPYYGELLVFDRVDNARTPDYFTGCRPTNSLSGRCSTTAAASRGAVGMYDASTDTHVMVVTDVADSNPNNRVYIAYYAKVGTNQLDGCFELCTINQCGRSGNSYYPMRGFRSASRNFIVNGSGPSNDGKSATWASLSTVIRDSGAKATTPEATCGLYEINPTGRSATLSALQSVAVVR